MRQFLVGTVVACSIFCTNFAKAEASRPCPDSFQDLADIFTQDLPDYLNRTYIRLGIDRHVLVAGIPETNSFPISSVNSSLTSPSQIFVSILSGKIGKPKDDSQPYWIFISKTSSGWRFVMAFTKIGSSVPVDVSDGAIANAAIILLKDICNYPQIMN